MYDIVIYICIFYSIDSIYIGNIYLHLPLPLPLLPLSIYISTCISIYTVSRGPQFIISVQVSTFIILYNYYYI